MGLVDLQKSVHEVPTYEEFFGILDNELDDEDFDYEDEDENKKKLIVVVLSLLEDFYSEVMYWSEYDILTEEFETKLAQFNTELKEILLILFDNYFEDVRAGLNIEYGIPSDIKISDLNIQSTIDSGVDRITNTLHDELTNKAHFYKDVVRTTGVFSLHSNFRRAIKNLTNLADFNAQYVKKNTERDYIEFVYGQEALAKWCVTGINTCAWCYELEAMGAMPISWFPVDHPNGRCWLEPVNPDEYSEQYKRVRGWI